MTKEEAIRVLYSIDNADEMDEELAEAYNMAIKALERESCEDVVSRQAVLDTIFAECSGTKLDIDFAKVLILQRAIKALPPVTPQPKTGHWIEVAKYSDGNHKIECSECGSYIFVRAHANSIIVKNKYRYCPNCGAKNGK